MRLDPKEVREGKYDGQIVWICDFRYTDFNIKAARDISPKKVIIRPTSETKNRVYYSNSFFSEIKNDKVVNSSVIKLYDNTGYRSYAGVPLNIFTTEEEAVVEYKKLAKNLLEDFKNFKENTISWMGVLERSLKLKSE